MLLSTLPAINGTVSSGSVSSCTVGTVVSVVGSSVCVIVSGEAVSSSGWDGSIWAAFAIGIIPRTMTRIRRNTMHRFQIGFIVPISFHKKSLCQQLTKATGDSCIFFFREYG